MADWQLANAKLKRMVAVLTGLLHAGQVIKLDYCVLCWKIGIDNNAPLKVIV